MTILFKLLVFSTFLFYNYFKMSKLWKRILLYGGISLFSITAIVCVCCAFLIKPNETILSINCKDSIVLELGQVYNLSIKCSDENAEISLKSANSDVVEIDGFDLISQGEGKTTVRVTASIDGKTVGKNVNITVKKTITNLGLSLVNKVTLYKLDKEIDKANNEGYFNSISYNTSVPTSYVIYDEEIVEIKNNKIIAKEIGETQVMFFATSDNKVTETITVKVDAFSPSLETNLESEINLKVSKKLSISYEITPKYYIGEANVTIRVVDSNIASVEEKSITGLSVGSTKIQILLNEVVVKEVNLNVTSDQSAVVTPPQEETTNNNNENNDNNENSYIIEDNENGENNQENNAEENNSENENQENLSDQENTDDENQNSKSLDPQIELESYTINIIPVANITVSGTTLTLLDYDACFQIEVLDSNNEVVILQNEIQISGMNVTVIMNNRYIIGDYESGELVISYPDLTISTTFNVVVE